MDLTTTYMGFKLPHPLICGASPLAESVHAAKRLEDAGAAAIVLHSLFEEQIEREALRIAKPHESASAYRESVSYFPKSYELPYGPHGYLEHVHRLKQAIHIPIIASLNGTTPSGWLKYSELIEDAGADGLELNFYDIPTDLKETSFEIEQRVLDCVRVIKSTIDIPIAVKLSPFYTAPANMIARLDEIGVHGLVLFNRFYQPDVGPDNMDMMPKMHLSNSSELLMRLRWLSILTGRIQTPMAVTGGVHTGEDAGRSIAAGAHAVQVVSVLIEHGPEHLRKIKEDLEHWMERHGYDSVSKLRGCMSMQNCPNTEAYERANYARVLQNLRP